MISIFVVFQIIIRKRQLSSSKWAALDPEQNLLVDGVIRVSIQGNAQNHVRSIRTTSTPTSQKNVVLNQGNIFYFVIEYMHIGIVSFY